MTNDDTHKDAASKNQADEIRKIVDDELFEAITKEANITQEQANKAVSDYLDRIG
mgnify:CR=1 FL=1